MAGRAAAAAAGRPMILQRVVLVVIALIVMTGLAVLIIWASVQPKKLHYSIEHGAVTGLDLSGERLNSDFKFVMRANNPNRHMSLYYDRLEVTVFYEDQKLSVNNVHPFHQPKRNVTFVDLPLVAKNATVYGATARDLKMELAAGELNLDVKLRAKIRLKVGVFKIHRTLKVDCQSVTLPFHSRKAFQRVLCHSDMDN